MYIIAPIDKHGPNAMASFAYFSFKAKIIIATIPPIMIPKNKVTITPFIPKNKPQTSVISASPIPIPLVIITMIANAANPINPPKT